MLFIEAASPISSTSKSASYEPVEADTHSYRKVNKPVQSEMMNSFIINTEYQTAWKAERLFLWHDQ